MLSEGPCTEGEPIEEIEACDKVENHLGEALIPRVILLKLLELVIKLKYT